MKIIVYEHISGGGCAEQPIPTGVLCEGFAMLRCVVADFKAAGHEVTVLMDARISKLNPPIDADFTVPIFYPGEHEKFLNVLAKINDAVYVIAPETGKILQTLVERFEKTEKKSLNCESKAIGEVADKALLCGELKKNGFPTPKTLVININNSLKKIKQSVNMELTYPVIFKPAEGVGCSGLSHVKEENQIEKAVAKIKAESEASCFIAQEFIRGQSASVSLMSTGKKAMALSLNSQNIILADAGGVSDYEGGSVPLDYWLKQDVFKIAEKVVEAFPGLRGYMGVDVVLTEHKAFVVDVNPRLTTSYVGLRKVVNFNVAEGLINAVSKSKLPGKTENHGVVCFSKIETSKPSAITFRKAAKLDAVVSPPFQLDDKAKSCALIIGEGENLSVAKQRLEEAKKHLLNILT